jgi:tyrosyl-tRNA synthetase
MITTDETKINELLTRGVQDILPGKNELKAKLMSGQRLKVYLGIDPTSPVVHIGHVSTFRKLRQFQDLGHEIIVLVGDFTAIAGDPDKTEARTLLTEEQIIENMQTYKEQISRIIKFDGENPATFVRNSEWLSKLTFKEVVGLASHFTVQQMMERDNFQKRLAAQTPIKLHEFLYPLMQGYDSVALDVDVELGGNDQLFNMMFGRTLLKDIKGKEKFVMTGKLIVDSSGKKIGKTDGNAWNFTLEPSDVYGKLMANPDTTIIQCFEQLTDTPAEVISEKKKEIENGKNPMELKKELAFKIIEQYYSKDEAEKAQNYFEELFQKKDLNIAQEKKFSGLPHSLDELIKELGFASSNTQIKNLIDAGAVEINGVKVTSIKITLPNKFTLKVGKKNIVNVIYE